MRAPTSTDLVNLVGQGQAIPVGVVGSDVLLGEWWLRRTAVIVVQRQYPMGCSLYVNYAATDGALVDVEIDLSGPFASYVRFTGRRRVSGEGYVTQVEAMS